MIPGKFAPFVFAFILSGLMSLLISGVTTFEALGPQRHFLRAWPGAWLTAWAVAFPVVLVVAPLTRRLVLRLTSTR